MFDIVSILTSLGVTFLRHRTIIPSFQLYVQTVSGMAALTGLLFFSIFWPPPSFLTLPCLVCTPAHQLRSFASLSALYTLFAHSPPRVAASVSTCPLPNLTFSSICLTPPPLLIPDAPPPPFALSPLRRLLLLFCATRAQPQQTNYTWRAELLDAHTVAADQHFPFYCTPYYGYSPPTHHDMHTMIFELATFLTSFAFLDDGSPLQELESASLSPGSLFDSL